MAKEILNYLDRERNYMINFIKKLFITNKFKNAYIFTHHPQFIKLRHYKKERKELLDFIENLKSEDYKNKTAYTIAEKNFFAGSSQFYWDLAEEQIYTQIKSLSKCVKDYDMIIRDKRELIRLFKEEYYKESLDILLNKLENVIKYIKKEYRND